MNGHKYDCGKLSAQNQNVDQSFIAKVVRSIPTQSDNMVETLFYAHLASIKNLSCLSHYHNNMIPVLKNMTVNKRYMTVPPNIQLRREELQNPINSQSIGTSNYNLSPLYT